MSIRIRDGLGFLATVCGAFALGGSFLLFGREAHAPAIVAIGGALALLVAGAKMLARPSS